MQLIFKMILTVLLIHLILMLIIYAYIKVKGEIKNENLNFVMKQIIKKKENFEWDGLSRLIIQYYMVTFLYALLQLKTLTFSSWFKGISSAIAILFVQLSFIFPIWIIFCEKDPFYLDFILEKETRGFSIPYKKKLHYFEAYNLMRK